MEIYIAAISAATTIVTVITPAWLTYRVKMVNLRNENDTLKKELAIQVDALSYEDLFVENNFIKEEIEKLCEETEIDRVLLLRAWNGEHTPRWTTAIWQYRTGKQDSVEYIHTELDDDYVAKLHRIKRSRFEVFETAAMEESLVRGIYEAEKVSHSMWVYLGSKRVTEKSSAMLYMSFASQSDQPLSNATTVKLSLLADRMKAVVQPLKSAPG